LWVDVTGVLQKGAVIAAKNFLEDPAYSGQLAKFLERLHRIASILDIDLHIAELTGVDKTVDVVVAIFNRVNSGGTKMSKGDLALAKVCAEWPEARKRLNEELECWSHSGYNFKIELLLRCITTTLTGEAKFSELDGVESPRFQDALKTAARHVNYLLGLIQGRLGLDHDRVLGGRYALPLMARYLEQRGGAVSDRRERDGLLYWYVHSFLWGRYTGSTESVLNQDLDVIENIDGGLDRLLDNLRRNRGDIQLHPDDFRGWSRGARFYPLLYMLLRAWGAVDWETGIKLMGVLPGSMNRLELHHIFPKAKLYAEGYDRSWVNAIANFTFLTKQTNLKVSAKDPARYLAAYAEKDETLLTSHWIPMDPELWNLDRYEDFLDARRELLAAAANDFLETLRRGKVPELEEADGPLVGEGALVPRLGIGAQEEEERSLNEVNPWVVDQGLVEGEILFELADPDSREVHGVLDVAWPDGLQEELSDPVALLLDGAEKTKDAANHAGYRYFTDVESFKRHVQQEVLVA